MVDVSEVEKKTELTRIASVEIGANLGGVLIASPADFELISARLARGGPAVPPHCRDKAGTVFALCMQALEWGMPIMSVINKSYVVSNRGTDRIAYESQLIHAVIEKNAPLKSRLRYEIMGNGDDRRCKVWGTFKGEDKPHEYLSETLGKLRDARGKNDQGQIKGSPLWETLPEVQMFYSASRQWARLFCPDVILGAYTPEDQSFAEPIDVTPDKVAVLSRRLRDAKLGEVRGFDNADVVRQVGSIIEGNATEADDDKAGSDVSRNRTGDKGRDDADRNRADDDRNEAASDQSGVVDPKAGAVSAADDTAQQDIFPPDRDAEKRKRKAAKRK